MLLANHLEVVQELLLLNSSDDSMISCGLGLLFFLIDEDVVHSGRHTVDCACHGTKRLRANPF